MTEIGDHAFYGCSGLTSVISLSKEPVDLPSTVFRDVTTATLYVPQGTKELYEAARGWKEFTGRIVEMDLSDIETVEGRSRDGVSVYDPSGRNLVGKLQHGINIIRNADGTTHKVLLK